MKLIDRYMLRSVLAPLAYCLTGFAMLYVVYDLFQNFNDFLEANADGGMIAKYYAMLLPSVMVRFVPVAMLLAVLFALSGLTKNNELTAMRACGMSLLRIMSPVLMVGLALSAAVAAGYEFFGPQAAFWCHNFLSAQKKNPDEVYVYQNREFMIESARRIWHITAFDIRSNSLRGVEIIQRRPDTSDESKLVAESARWLDGRWWFVDAMEQHYDTEGFPDGPPRHFHGLELPQIRETPDDFLREIKDPNEDEGFLSSREIRVYLEHNPHLEADNRARLWMSLYSKQALPWATLVMAMLGIPFGNQTGRRGALLGVMLSIGMLVSYFFLLNICEYLGRTAVLSAWLAAWLPNMLYATAGLILVARLR